MCVSVFHIPQSFNRSNLYFFLYITLFNSFYPSLSFSLSLSIYIYM